MLPRQFSLTAAKGGRATVGQAEGSGSGTRCDSKAFLTQTSVTFGLLEPGTRTCFSVNFLFPRQKTHECSRLLKKAATHFINRCTDYPFETEKTHMQTGRNISPLLDEGTERGAIFSPLLPLQYEFQGEKSHGCLLDLSGLHIHKEEDEYPQTFSFLVT